MIAATAFVALRRPLPPRTGTHRLPGLESPVEVLFDSHSIPHVRARTTADAYRALGWLHAGDRFFQMEMRRRFADGRVAEVLGPSAFAADVDARREGHARLAESDESLLDPADRRVAEAYAEGVNGYLSSHPRPIELIALGIVPSPWTVRDSLAFGRLMNAFLSDSGDRETAILRAVGAHGLDVTLQALAVEDGRSPHRPPLDGSSVSSFDPAPEEPPSGGASNAFALAGSRTASGKPILASDPHLPLEPIAIWYVAHLSTDDGLDVAGVTLAGLPFVAIGHNGEVAWGITMQQADDTDLFLEHDAGTSRVETIAVRGSEPRNIVVRDTAQGPVIGTAGRFAVVRARASRRAATSIAAFAGAARAHDGKDLAAAFQRYSGPPLNVVWADSGGHIGIRTAGAIPIRGAGDGRIPVPLVEPYGWTGLRPADSLPAIDDPPDGFVASGNDDWSLAGAPLPYPGHYLGRDRIGRLREYLAGITGGSVAAARELQNDLTSLYAKRVVRALTVQPFADAKAETARGLLAQWDGRVDLRGASLLYFQTMMEIRRAAIGTREQRAGEPLPIGWDGLAAMITGDEAGFFWDDPETPEIETRTAVLSRALSTALARVEDDDGADPAAWSFGRRHVAMFAHPFSPAFPWLLGALDLSPAPLPGDWHTPRVAGFSLRRGEFRVLHIQSTRMIVDLGDPDATRIVLPQGQSGQIADPHRGDQLAIWAAGGDVPFPFSRTAVAASTVSRVRLIP